VRFRLPARVLERDRVTRLDGDRPGANRVVSLTSTLGTKDAAPGVLITWVVLPDEAVATLTSVTAAAATAPAQASASRCFFT
jgi:hypothetical protein